MEGKLISITQANDWWAVYRSKVPDGGFELCSDVVVCWALTSEGEIVGMVDAGGYLDRADEVMNFDQYVHAKSAYDAETIAFEEYKRGMRGKNV